MPWTTPETFTAGQTLTAASMNVLSGNDGFLYKPPMCSVYRSAALSHTSNGAYQSISWDAENYDTNGMWVVGSPTRITLNVAGLYVVTLNVSAGASATGFRIARIDKDGAGAAYGDTTPGNSTVNYCHVSALVQSTGSNYVEASVYQNSGGNLAYGVGATTMQFSAAWIGNPA